MKLKKNRKPPSFNAIITVMLFIAVLVVGYFVFLSWQNRQQVIEVTNVNIGSLPESGDREVPERTPLGTAQPDYLWIPDRGIEAPVVYVNETTEEAFQKGLEGGVVHYPGTAVPGEPGNPYLFGHSSDYLWKAGDYKQVLKDLIDIPLETKVRITNHAGELFIFRVIETKIVGPKEVSVLDQQNYERVLLTLQTSYPLGTALKRYIAVCELDDEATYGPAGTAQ
ncbi:MAG: sortase [Patescibacteria group bacterium]